MVISIIGVSLDKLLAKQALYYFRFVAELKLGMDKVIILVQRHLYINGQRQKECA